MRTLSIDIETYSSVDLMKAGVYTYTQSDDFTILLFGYAFDDEEVRVIDLTSETLPKEVESALISEAVIKTAFNANFERTCLSKYLNLELPSNQWRCTSVHALMLGLPNSLAVVSQVLKLPEQKMSIGKTLIRYFSMPCAPTKTNGGRTRNLPHHDLEKWELFKEYCKRDVEVEIIVKKKIEFYKITDFEQKLWELDQRINDEGVAVDMELVENAIKIDENYTNKLVEEAKAITGLDNVNSVAQLKKFLQVEDLSKAAVAEMIKTTDDETTKRVLELRQLMSKTSVKKYEAMSRCVCPDGRVRGLFQYYGANRTGRWAGRLVQVQNLPQNHLSDLDTARELVKDGDYESVEMLYDNVPKVLSELIRTAFVGSNGNRFIVADFSAIEARVIAWLANEKWRQEVFKTHGKIYEASASQMFKVPLESVTKGSALRQKGKVSELALGYQGGVGALKQMGALDMGLEEDELQGLVDAWRHANPNIVKLWYEVGNAAAKAIDEKTTVNISHNIKFIYSKGCLFIQLPSGRRLSYLQASIETVGSRRKMTYQGMNQTSKKWEKIDTYGGKILYKPLQEIV